MEGPSKFPGFDEGNKGKQFDIELAFGRRATLTEVESGVWHIDSPAIRAIRDGKDYLLAFVLSAESLHKLQDNPNFKDYNLDDDLHFSGESGKFDYKGVEFRLVDDIYNEVPYIKAPSSAVLKEALQDIELTIADTWDV